MVALRNSSFLCNANKRFADNKINSVDENSKVSKVEIQQEKYNSCVKQEVDVKRSQKSDDSETNAIEYSANNSSEREYKT